MLDTWMEGVKRCGVKNAMVIALDAETKANAEAFGIPAFEMHLEVRFLDPIPKRQTLTLQLSIGNEALGRALQQLMCQPPFGHV